MSTPIPFEKGRSSTFSSGSYTAQSPGFNHNIARTTNAVSTDRRASHNATERARREALNGKFMDLAHLNPILVRQIATETGANKKPSKSQIVQRSLDYILFMRQRSERRDRLLAELATENDMLRAELNRYRLHTGAEMLPERDEAVTEMIHRTEEEDLDIYMRNLANIPSTAQPLQSSVHSLVGTPPTPSSLTRRLSEVSTFHGGYPPRQPGFASFNENNGSATGAALPLQQQMFSNNNHFMSGVDTIAQSCPSQLQFIRNQNQPIASAATMPFNFQAEYLPAQTYVQQQPVPSALSGAIQRARQPSVHSVDEGMEDDESLMAGEDVTYAAAAEQELMDEMLQFEE